MRGLIDRIAQWRFTMANLSKDDALRILSDAPEQNFFWCNDGKVLKNLYDLEAALSEMSDETFKYHANSDKNDFANWVFDLFGDEVLAKSLVKAKTKGTALKRVKSRIDSVSKKLL